MSFLFRCVSSVNKDSRRRQLEGSDGPRERQSLPMTAETKKGLWNLGITSKSFHVDAKSLNLPPLPTLNILPFLTNSNHALNSSEKTKEPSRPPKILNELDIPQQQGTGQFPKRRGASCGNIFEVDGTLNPKAISTFRSRLWLPNAKDVVVNVYRSGMGLGISLLTYKRDYPVISEIHDGGAVHKDARLNVGDQIVEANGLSLFGRSSDDIRNILCAHKCYSLVSFCVRPSTSDYPITHLQLCLPTNDECDNWDKPPSDVTLFCFYLKPPSLGVPFGIVLEDRWGLRPGIYIKELMPQSHAEVDGQLLTDDQILKVGDVFVNESEHAAQLILRRKFDPTVRIWVARHNDEAAPSVANGPLSGSDVDVNIRSTISGVNELIPPPWPMITIDKPFG